MNPASIAEMALNFAINACFGFAGTKKGQAHSGKLMGLSIALGVVDLFVQLFGGGSQPDKNQVAITPAMLKQDLDDLFDRIDDDLFQQFETQELASMKLVLHDFQFAWTAAIGAVTSHTGMPEEDDALNQAWSQYFDAFNDEVNKTSSKTLGVTNWIETACDPKTDPKGRRFMTMSLYMMAAGLFLNICQLNLLVEWTKIQNDASKTGSAYQKALAKWRDVDMANYRKALATWHAQINYNATVAQQNLPPGAVSPFSPGGGGILGGPSTLGGNPGPFSKNTYIPPKPKMPDRPRPPPAAFDDLYAGPNANAIRNWTPIFIAYAEPIIKEMEAGVSERDSHRKKRMASPVLLDMGAGLGAVSDPLGQIVPMAVPMAVAKAQFEVIKGQVSTGLTAMEDPRLKYTTDDEVKKNRATLENWKQTLDHYTKTGP